MTFPETINQAGLGGFTNISTGYVQVAGVCGIGTNGGQKMDYTNLSPRLGFAYQVRPDIVVRGGAATGDSLFLTGITSHP
jgi:outer membrane receptor protein involved in Fe transport